MITSHKRIIDKLAASLLMLLAFFYSDQISAQEQIVGKTALLYKHSFKKYQTAPDRLYTDYVIVSVMGNESFSQIFANRKTDSISTYRPLTNDDVRSNRTTAHSQRVWITNDSATFYGRVGKEYYQYTEKVDFNWKLTDITKKINGYDCRKAVGNYAGREWIAWFSTQIPIVAGPYKFSGLPGCIVKVSDTNENFNYELIQIKAVDYIQPRIYSGYGSNFIKIDRIKFNKLREKYMSLSFSDAMAYANRNDPNYESVFSVSNDEEDPLLNRSLKTEYQYYFMEIDHIE